MIQLLNQYLYIFLHPFHIHAEYQLEREKRKLKSSSNIIPFTPEKIEGQLELDELGSETNDVERNHLHAFTRVEGIAISWTFAAIMGMYEILVINISLLSYDYFSTDNTLSAMLLEKYSQNTQGLFLFFTLFNVVIFPLTALVYLKFWEVMIRFFAQVFSVEENHEEIIEEILSCSLTSHLLLVIPVFGRVAHYTANLIYIFAGLKNNMGLSTLQSTIVICSPMFFLLIILFLIFFFLFAIFGMI